MVLILFYGAPRMLNRLMSSAKRTTLNLARRIVFATASLVILTLAWPVGCQSQAALGAESAML